MQRSGRARVVYVGEAPLGAMGFETCLAQAGHELLAVCHEPNAAMEVIEEHQPNLIAIGTLRSEVRAFRLAQAVITRWPETPVILFSRRPDDRRRIEDAAYIGARAFVDAAVNCPDLLAIIRRVLAGATLFTPDQLRAAYQLEELTSRQSELLNCLSNGLRAAGAAQELGVAVSTVNNQLTEIRLRLDVHGTRDAVARAQRRGII